MRAAIRAKVTAARMERAQASEQASEIARAARGYFDFALQAITPPPAKFAAIGGLSGTGKTRLARMLAPDFKPMPGAVIVRSDVERKAPFGVGETEKLTAGGLHRRSHRRSLCHARRQGARILAAGHSVIVDAVFAEPRERALWPNRQNRRDCPLHGLFLTADLNTRLARVGRRATTSDADAAVAQAQERYDLGRLDWTPVDASGTPENTLARAKAALASA